MPAARRVLEGVVEGPGCGAALTRVEGRWAAFMSVRSVEIPAGVPCNGPVHTCGRAIRPHMYRSSGGRAGRRRGCKSCWSGSR